MQTANAFGFCVFTMTGIQLFFKAIENKRKTSNNVSFKLFYEKKYSTTEPFGYLLLGSIDWHDGANDPNIG